MGYVIVGFSLFLIKMLCSYFPREDGWLFSKLLAFCFEMATAKHTSELIRVYVRGARWSLCLHCGLQDHLLIDGSKVYGVKITAQRDLHERLRLNGFSWWVFLLQWINHLWWRWQNTVLTGLVKKLECGTDFPLKHQFPEDPGDVIWRYSFWRLELTLDDLSFIKKMNFWGNGLESHGYFHEKYNRHPDTED